MSDGRIVTVMDRMLSSADDTVPGTEALKGRKISVTWGIMFAGNGELFLPIVNRILNTLDHDKIYDLLEMQSCIVSAYREMLDEQFTSIYLSKYGIKNIDEFVATGLSRFGDKFYEICRWLDDYNMSIELLVDRS
jgi:hypothetical protein